MALAATATTTGAQAVYTPYVDMTLRSDPMLAAIRRQTGSGRTDLWQACTSVRSLAAAYRQAVASHDANEVDFDLEGRALASAAGSRREILAIGQLEPDQFSHIFDAFG